MGVRRAVLCVSTRLRRRSRSTTTMSVWFIIAGSGARSTVSASSRPSGAISKSSAEGSHGGSASPVPASASRQRPVATSQTKTCGSRPSASQWSQIAVFGSLGDMRLDLGVLLLLAALRLQRIRREVRPHPRDEGKSLAVGEPLDRRRAARQARESRRFAAIGRNQIDLRLVVIVAFRGEGDEAAIRPPLGIAVLVTGGEPPGPGRGAAGSAADSRRIKPQLGAAVVFRHVVARDRRAGKRAIGRERRCADAA